MIKRTSNHLSRKKTASAERPANAKPQAIACRIEFDGERAHLFLEAKRSRVEKQTFEMLVSSVKFEVRYELPRSRAKALRTLKRGSFNSHSATADSVNVLPGKPGFSSHAHDWYRGFPRVRSTWRGLTELSEEEESMQRISAYEYLSHGGYRAVTLEMDDGEVVTVRSSEKAFTPEQFLEGAGTRILELLGRQPQ